MPPSRSDSWLGAPGSGGARFLLAALLALAPAFAAQAMARKPATVPVDAAPAPAWVKTGDGSALPGPDELAVRWLGTAGFEIRSARAAILIDPYYSRTPLGQLLAGPARPDEAAIRARVRPVNAVFVGHSHFDHMIDAPTVARLTRAHLYGSAATLAVAGQEGLPAAQGQAIKGGDRVKVGDLQVEVVASRHSSMATQWLAGGEMPAHVTVPMRFLEYKNGPVFGFLISWRGRTFYHCGSADVAEAHLAGKRAETVLFCVSGWKSSPDVIKRLYETLRPALILPMHHDDFFKPFEAGVQENLLAYYGEALGVIRRDAPGAAIREVGFFDDHRFRARD